MRIQAARSLTRRPRGACASRDPDAVGGRDRQHQPGERVLEEPAVEERVHEQPDERRAERERERLVPAPELEDQRHAAHEQPGVEDQPHHAQLREHRERRGVRHEVRRRPVATHEPAARARLPADADAHDGMLLDHSHGVLHAFGAVARDPVQRAPVRHLHRHVGARGHHGREREQRHGSAHAPVAGGDRQRRASSPAAPPCSTASTRTGGPPTSARAARSAARCASGAWRAARAPRRYRAPRGGRRGSGRRRARSRGNSPCSRSR